MKREQRIRELRKSAKALGLDLIVDPARGKGGHWVLRVAGRFSVIQSGKISPKMEATIRKQLGLLDRG